MAVIKSEYIHAWIRQRGLLLDEGYAKPLTFLDLKDILDFCEQQESEYDELSNSALDDAILARDEY